MIDSFCKNLQKFGRNFDFFLKILIFFAQKLKIPPLQKGLEGRRRRTGAKHSAIVLARSAPGWSECETLESLVRSVAEHLPKVLKNL
jgi:hypothetical protein